MPTKLTRQQLYDLVWSEPMTKLAKRFSLSDVALHKICRKHDVPTPRAGYWAKKAYGKPAPVTPLPRRNQAPDILIYDGAKANEPETVAAARAAMRASLNKPELGPLPTNTIVERTVSHLATAKPGRDGLVRAAKPNMVAMALRLQCLERAGNILRALVAAGEAAGLSLERGDSGAAWRCDGETVTFELVEAADQVEHVATAAELTAVAKWQRERDERFQRSGYLQTWGEPKIPKWERVFQGRLKIQLEEVRVKNGRSWWGEAIMRTFADSRTRDVANAIPRIIETIAAIAAAKRSNAALEARQRLEREAADRARRAAERQRLLDEKTQVFIEQLFDDQHQLERLAQLAQRMAAADAPLASRSAKLLAWAEHHIGLIQTGLTSDVIEERLRAAQLFDDDALGDHD